MRPFLVALFILLLSIVSTTGVALADDSEAYTLGSGDKIRVTVFDEKDLSGDYEVNDQGFVALPLIGQVHVGGKSLNDVEKAITASYGKDYLVNPRVSVEVLNYRPFFILGEVNKPNSYPYVSGMTVIQAVTLGGGYTARADKNDIHIKHINSGDTAEHAAKENTVVLPGDTIRVGERLF